MADVKNLEDLTLLSSINLERVEKAIKNEWPLRPVKNMRFHNIGYEKGTKIDEPSHILSSINDLKKFPDGTDALCLVPGLVPGFLCLDFDSEDSELNDKVRSLILSHYKKEELFLRLGNPKKLGQMWFHYTDNLPEGETKNLDVIVYHKRCDAIGQYKSSDSEYRWPFKNIWESGPKELPLIKKELVFEIVGMIRKFYGQDEDSIKEKVRGNRHDYLVDFTYAKICEGLSPLEVVRQVEKTSVWQELLAESEERATAAISSLPRMIAGAVGNALTKNHIRQVYIPDNAFEAFTNENQKDTSTQAGSLIDILYHAVKRNQYKSSAKMAFFTALSAAAWLLTLSTRYKGAAPNLLILYIAKSGAGKTTSGKLFQALLGLDPRLFASYAGSDALKTNEGFMMSFQHAPIKHFHIDEAGKFLKQRHKSNSNMTGIAETLCQYTSDFDDHHLQSVSIKAEQYGVCYGPKLNALMFTTPETYKNLSKEEFLGGLGRRTLMYIDPNTYLHRRDREDTEKFFTTKEEHFIRSFLNKYIFTVDSETSLQIFDEKNILHLKLKKGKNSKGEEMFHSTALAPIVINKLTETKEVTTYLKTTHLDKADALVKEVVKSGENISLPIVNAFPEFTTKLAMIHSLAGKTEPSLEVGLESVKWAEDTFNRYMIGDLVSSIKDVFVTDEDQEKIVELSQKVYEHLKENEVVSFKRSTNAFRNRFRKQDNKYKQDVLDHLIANGKIESQTSKTSITAAVFKVL